LCAAALCACVLLPQWHVCFLGIAAVTLPQPHACCGGCGQTLSGLPGFLTGTISLSFAWVHFVDRWPRIQGSLDRKVSVFSAQILVCERISGVMILEDEAWVAITKTCPATSSSSGAQRSNVPGHLHSIDQRHDDISRQMPSRVMSNQLLAGDYTSVVDVQIASRSSKALSQRLPDRYLHEQPPDRRSGEMSNQRFRKIQQSAWRVFGRSRSRMPINQIVGTRVG
jgi:hypothetical protein